MNRETVQVLEENIYFDMELKNETGARVYENIASDTRTVPEVKQTAFENEKAKRNERSTQPRKHPQSDADVVRRLLCIIIAVVAVFFLIAACTLILAVLVLMFHRDGTASADFSSVQGKRTLFQFLPIGVNYMRGGLRWTAIGGIWHGEGDQKRKKGSSFCTSKVSYLFGTRCTKVKVRLHNSWQLFDDFILSLMLS